MSRNPSTCVSCKKALPVQVGHAPNAGVICTECTEKLRAEYNAAITPKMTEESRLSVEVRQKSDDIQLLVNELSGARQEVERLRVALRDMEAKKNIIEADAIAFRLSVLNDSQAREINRWSRD